MNKSTNGQSAIASLFSFSIAGSISLSIVSSAAMSLAQTIQTRERIVEADAELVEHFSQGGFTEGVTVAPDGQVYFVDNRTTVEPGDRVGATYKFNPDSGETTVFISPNGQVNGMKFTAAGDLLMATRAGFGMRSLLRLNLDTMETYLIAGLWNRRQFNGLNDVAVAPDGTMFVTDPRYIGSEPIEQPHYGVYAITPSLEISLVTADVLKPNGVAVSPDGQTLYVSEHFIGNQNTAEMTEAAQPIYGPMRVLAYDLNGTTVVNEPRVIVDFGSNDGPDGMITDAAGNLYVAARAEPDFGVRVYSPAGEELAFIPTPQKPTNVAFGREQSRGTLYITAGGSLFSINTAQEGWVPLN